MLVLVLIRVSGDGDRRRGQVAGGPRKHRACGEGSSRAKSDAYARASAVMAVNGGVKSQGVCESVCACKSKCVCACVCVSAMALSVGVGLGRGRRR